MICLKVGGERSVVTTDEVVNEILPRWNRTMKWYKKMNERDGDGDGDDESSRNQNGIYKLDLSCRSWKADVLRGLLGDVGGAVGFAEENGVSRTLRILQADDIIASLPTGDGLATIRYVSARFSNSPALEELNLNDNALGIRGVELLRPLFRSAPNLRRLYMNNCGLSSEVGEALVDSMIPGGGAGGAGGEPVILPFTDLSFNKNMLGVEGGKQVGKILGHCPHLRYFTYAGCRPQNEGTSHVCKGLQRAAASASASGGWKLQVLDMNDCNFGSGEEEEDPVNDLCKVLDASSRLRKLVVRDGGLQLGGLKSVLSSLKTSGAQLEHFDAGANIDDDDQGVPAAAAFSSFAEGCDQTPSLQTLIWDTNVLSDRGIQVLLAPFVTCADRCQLREVNLECNEIANDGAKALIMLSEHIPSLQDVVLVDNADITVSMGDKLRKVFQHLEIDDDLDEDDDGDEGGSSANIDDLTSALCNLKM